ncbi:MAG: hypothetical protein CALGDGBN_00317 [Pseudomonadales bacterium]|nr:hypothetical protein [Pseudomonadales bacterium]
MKTSATATDDLLHAVVRVVAVGDGEVRVVADQQAACGGCSVAAGCGSRRLASRGASAATAVRIDGTVALAIGDLLEVGIDGAALTRAAALFYLLPLLGLASGALLAGLLQWSNGPALLAGMAGFAAAFPVCRRLHGARGSAALRPVFVRKLDRPGACTTGASVIARQL